MLDVSTGDRVSDVDCNLADLGRVASSLSQIRILSNMIHLKHVFSWFGESNWEIYWQFCICQRPRKIEIGTNKLLAC